MSGNSFLRVRVLFVVTFPHLRHPPLRALLTPALIMAMLAGSLTLLVLTPSAAQADGLDRRTVITWNMQGEGLAGQPGAKWEQARRYMRQASVLLLQESGSGPPSSLTNDSNERVSSITNVTPDGDLYENSTWNPETETAGIGPYEVYFLQTDSGSTTGGRVNIAIMTREVPDEIRAVDNPVANARRALGVRFGNHWYFSFHGRAHAHNDSSAMLNAIDNRVEAWGHAAGREYQWAVGGDFNAEPGELTSRPDFPPSWTYNPGQETQQSGRELDYVVADELHRNHEVTRLERGGSDHWAVRVGPSQPRPDASPPVPTRTLSMGDSLSSGENSSRGNGYRAFFTNDILNNGHVDPTGVFSKRDVDMVGSQRSGTMSDPYHEGFPGHRIDEIAHKTECSVKKYRPNVVTLMAGTNDMNQNYQLSTAPERLGALIDRIVKDAPEATVLVATLTPSTKAGLQPRIDRYNAELPRIVDERRQQGKKVRLVHMGAVTTADINGTHPHDGGYAKMAKAFGDALLLVEREGWLQQPVPGDPGACGTPEDPDQSGPGDGWRSLDVVAPGMTHPTGHTDLADFDGDGRDDYVRIPDEGQARIAINTRANPGKPHWVEVESGYEVRNREEAESIRFADLNGDGRDDIIRLSAGSEWILYRENKGVRDGKIEWNAHSVSVKVGYGDIPRADIRFADINGDGRDDLLRVGENSSVHAYFNLPTSDGWFRFVERRNWAPGVSYATRDRLRFADVDGDGKDDYLVVGTDGRVHAHINNGGRGDGGFTEHLNFVRTTNYPGAKSTFRDISGDGKADYVVFEGGLIRCWLNLGGNM